MLLYRFLLEIIPYFCVQVTCIRIILPRYPGQDPYSDWRSLPDQGLVGNYDQHSIFVFPGYVNWARITSAPRNPVISTRQNVYLPDKSVIAKNCPLTSTFCESVDNYPADYINNLVEDNLNKYKEFFDSNRNINKRIGLGQGDDGRDNICPSTAKLIQPVSATNARNEWKYLVNTVKFVQVIRAELCDKVNASCSVHEYIPFSYKTECVQKHIFRKFVSLDGTGQLHTESFRMPACCVCSIRATHAKRSVLGLK